MTLAIERKRWFQLNIIALKQKMLEKRKSNKDLAFELGISRSAIQRKLSGGVQFSQGELKVIIDVLSLSQNEVMTIFFDGEVS